MDNNKMSFKIRQFLMFAGPALVLFVGTVIVPLIYGFYLTFTSWDGVALNKPFVGVQNYIDAFHDSSYWASLGRTFIYSFFAVILINLVAFALAYLVTRGIKGQNFFRAGFFVPNLIGGIVLGYVWQYAGYMMLIYVAGFMSVPESLKEAALIDGCNPGQALRKIILPLMRASFVQCLFLSITRCFVVYDVNLSLTNGDPFGSSELAAMHVYNTAFTYRNYGVGQAEALILFIVCAIIGVTQVYVGKKGEVEA